MSAPDWLTQSSESTVVVAAIPALFAASYALGRLMESRSGEEEAKILLASGLVVLGVAGLYASLCDGDRRGACALAPSW